MKNTQRADKWGNISPPRDLYGVISRETKVCNQKGRQQVGLDSDLVIKLVIMIKVHTLMSLEAMIKRIKVVNRLSPNFNSSNPRVINLN